MENKKEAPAAPMPEKEKVNREPEVKQGETMVFNPVKGVDAKECKQEDVGKRLPPIGEDDCDTVSYPNRVAYYVGEDEFPSLAELRFLGGVSPEIADKMIALYWEKVKYDDKKELQRRIAEARKNFGDVLKGTEAKIEKDGKVKKTYKYAPLPSMQEAIDKPLADQGLSYRFEEEIFKSSEGNPMMKIIAICEHGLAEKTGSHVVPIDLETRFMNNIQSFGSAASYGMKRALAFLFAIKLHEDDDANTKGEKESDKKKEKKPPTAAKEGKENGDAKNWLFPFEMVNEPVKLLRKYRSVLEWLTNVTKIERLVWAQNCWYKNSNMFESMVKEDAMMSLTVKFIDQHIKSIVQLEDVANKIAAVDVFAAHELGQDTA